MLSVAYNRAFFRAAVVAEAGPVEDVAGAASKSSLQILYTVTTFIF
jgi:hypothetical protein